MIQITQQRNKCIGCNACVEAAPGRWRMSRRDGKSVLVGAKQSGKFYSVNVGADELDANTIAAKNCPVHIIRVKVL